MEIAKTTASGVGQDPAKHGSVHHAVTVFDLAAQTPDLRGTAKQDTTARTLVRLRGLRVTLMALPSQAKVAEHKTSHQMSIHTLSGHVAVRVGDDVVDVPEGHIVILESGVGHEITASEHSTLLLTVSGPEDAVVTKPSFRAACLEPEGGVGG